MRNKARYTHFTNEQTQRKHYALKEKQAWIEGWIASTRIPEINARSAVMLAENKISQLKTAYLVDFDIPETRITNDRQTILEAFAGDEEIVIKPLSTPVVPSHAAEIEPIMMHTSVITLKEVEESPEAAFVQAPVIVQQKITSRFEVRVIQVGARSCAIRIDKPDGACHIDSRLYHKASRYSAFELPPEIARRCTRFLQDMGLHMGAFDFCVTPEGRIVFLECNPSGQWAWMERGMDEPAISNFVGDAFYDMLSTRNGSGLSGPVRHDRAARPVEGAGAG